MFVSWDFFNDHTRDRKISYKLSIFNVRNTIRRPIKKVIALTLHPPLCVVYKNNETLTKRRKNERRVARTRDRWLYDRYRGTIGEREHVRRETSTREGRFPAAPALSSFGLLIVVINKKISGRMAVRDDYR